MAKQSKGRKVEPFVVHWTRLALPDSAELHRRAAVTGASPAAQIRIIVHEALASQKGKIR